MTFQNVLCYSVCPVVVRNCLIMQRNLRSVSQSQNPVTFLLTYAILLIPFIADIFIKPIWLYLGLCPPSLFSLFLHYVKGHSGVNESIVPEGEGWLCRGGLSVGVELWDPVPSSVWAGQRAESLSLLLLFVEKEAEIGRESRGKREMWRGRNLR